MCGGGWVKGRIASQGRFVPVSSRKQMATYDFHGEVRTPCPLCLRPYQSFKQFEFTFYLFFAGPGQFTKRLLIISADAKGKDSMILLRSKRPRTSIPATCCFRQFGVARDDGLDARKCT